MVSIRTFNQLFLPVLFLLVAITLFILFGTFSTNIPNKKIFKIIALIVSITIILTVGISIFTKDYRSLTKYETNANRKIKIAILHYERRLNSSSNNATLYDINKTLNLPFYEKETTTETDSLTYLGKNDVFYFFTDDKNIFQLDLSSDRLVFQPIDHVSITKEYAKLSDKRFKDIDFKEKIGPDISSIIVPESKRDLLYKPNVITNDKLKKAVPY
ncbi:hypothetical protein BW731_08160 [Vagococcus martis]|uniref:Uncharacterized protein n=1 Tax=Vagococcus martis TaxID=1768210 RepID=A0A1V4DI49_9ENTE|nr:hypothetical protein BW731_08160 [Vagococcus martis]